MNIFSKLGDMPFEEAMMILRDFCQYLNDIDDDKRLDTEVELELFVFKREHNTV